MNRDIPRAVSSAVLLIGLAYLAGIAKWAWLNDWSNPVVDGLQLILGTIALTWALNKLRWGSRLWRSLYTLFFCFAALTAVLRGADVAQSWEMTLLVAQLLAQGLGTVLLFFPASNQYFSPAR